MKHKIWTVINVIALGGAFFLLAKYNALIIELILDYLGGK